MLTKSILLFRISSCFSPTVVVVLGTNPSFSNYSKLLRRYEKVPSSYLRTALYQATVSAISKQIHGPAKVTIVAASHKLLLIIFWYVEFW
ncbi:hypothetical protein QPK24_10975 [Paenibacillus polygoni]|uniref:Uncharacterized protein n=1 Tax=Paenibacillus polygoni TaxID=3050112 RepID=A0ABY8X6J0_9BACL|nr:hypothetical protein [Paenibacillus polygoni]WIV21150.1 hypothetical protein QPK24_10975 [Paenibacillus polygoni]